MHLTASVVRYAGGAVLARHAHSTGGFSVVIAGAIEEEVGGRTEIGRLGSLVIKSAGIEHHNRVGPNGAVLLAIKGATADELACDRWRWSESYEAAVAGIQVARRLRFGRQVDGEELLDLLGFAAAPSTAIERRQTDWLHAIRSRLDREPEGQSVTALADHADVHPVYLARAFRQQFGCSIREYRRKGRVRRAADLLGSCNARIASVAAQAGFYDQSHLCRDFRAELAVSPSDYRAIIRS